VELRGGEKIVGYTFNVQNTFLYSVPKLARNWDMTIYNGTTENPPWSTSVAATTKQLGSAIYPAFLHDFVRLTPFEAGDNRKPYDCKLFVYASDGSGKRRKFSVHRSDIVFDVVAGNVEKSNIVLPKDLGLKGKERIVSISFFSDTGYIAALPKVYRCWNETISTKYVEGKRLAHLFGTIGVGAGAIYPADLNGFALLQPLENEHKPSNKGDSKLTLFCSEHFSEDDTRKVNVPVTIH